VGRSGPRRGDAIWPEENTVFVIWCGAEEAAGIHRAVASVKQLFPNEGLKLFEMDTAAPAGAAPQESTAPSWSAPEAPSRDSLPSEGYRFVDAGFPPSRDSVEGYRPADDRPQEAYAGFPPSRDSREGYQPPGAYSGFSPVSDGEQSAPILGSGGEISPVALIQAIQAAAEISRMETVRDAQAAAAEVMSRNAEAVVTDALKVVLGEAIKAAIAEATASVHAIAVKAARETLSKEMVTVNDESIRRAISEAFKPKPTGD
jgi:hypothetical protein